jgi:hypothetical protein
MNLYIYHHICVSCQSSRQCIFISLFFSPSFLFLNINLKKNPRSVHKNRSVVTAHSFSHPLCRLSQTHAHTPDLILLGIYLYPAHVVYMYVCHPVFVFHSFCMSSQFSLSIFLSLGFLFSLSLYTGGFPALAEALRALRQIVPSPTSKLSSSQSLPLH